MTCVNCSRLMRLYEKVKNGLCAECRHSPQALTSRKAKPLSETPIELNRLVAKETASPSFQWQPGMTLSAVRRSAILQSLAFFHGSRVRTAIALGISYRTLTNLLKQFRDEGDEVTKAPRGVNSHQENLPL